MDSAAKLARRIVQVCEELDQRHGQGNWTLADASPGDQRLFATSAMRLANRVLHGRGRRARALAAARREAWVACKWDCGVTLPRSELRDGACGECAGSRQP